MYTRTYIFKIYSSSRQMHMGKLKKSQLGRAYFQRGLPEISSGNPAETGPGESWDPVEVKTEPDEETPKIPGCSLHTAVGWLVCGLRTCAF